MCYISKIKLYFYLVSDKNEEQHPISQKFKYCDTTPVALKIQLAVL